MTLVSLMLIAAVSGPQIVPQAKQSRPACTPADLQRAGVAPGQFKRLDELPPALHQLAVLRIVGGCSVLTVRVGAQTYYLPSQDRAPPVMPLDGRVHRQR